MPTLWRNLRGWLLLAAILGGGYGLLHLVFFRPQPVGVRAHRVSKGIVERTVSNTRAGSVRTRWSAELSPDTAGRVVEIVHREGATVNKGDALIRLDARSANALIALARRDLEVAIALRDQAKIASADAAREFARSDSLRAEGAVAKADWDRAKSLVDTTAAALAAAEARVDQARAHLHQAEVEADKLVLRAPFAGQVARLNIEVGEWAVPGRAVLRLIDPRELFIRAEIDEVDIGRVRDGLNARVTLDPYKGRTFEGRVRRVAPHVTEVLAENRSVEIDVELTGGLDGEILKPGTSADVEVILEATDGTTLRIPTLAVMEGKKVLVARDGVAREVAIETGLRNWDWTEVRSGLAEGDLVIVSLDRKEVRAGARIVIEKEADR